MKYRLIIDKHAEEEIRIIAHAPSSLTQQIENLVCSYSGADCILGFREDDSAAYVEYVEKVGEDWYIVITESYREPSIDIGWREGYGRSFTKLFRYTPKTGDYELIHSY